MKLNEIIDENIQSLNLKNVIIFYDENHEILIDKLFTNLKSNSIFLNTHNISFEFFKNYLNKISDDSMIVLLLPLFKNLNINNHEFYKILMTLEITGKYLINISAGIDNVWDKTVLQNYNKLLAKLIDYSSIKEISNISNDYLLRLRENKLYKLEDKNGTELFFEVDKIHIENFPLTAENRVIQIPHGEVFIVPKMNSINGKVILKKKYDTLVFNIKNDYTNIEMSSIKGKFPVCEIGFGTNSCIPMIYNLPYFEKKLGTYHLGFGGNESFGGKYSFDYHFDIVNPVKYEIHEV